MMMMMMIIQSSAFLRVYIYQHACLRRTDQAFAFYSQLSYYLVLRAQWNDL